MLALFAGVQIEAALGTLSEGSGQVLKQGSALGTARHSARAWHVDGTRAKSIFSLRTGTWGRWLVEFFFCACAGILISVLAILTVGQKRLLENVTEFAHCPPLGAPGTRVSLARKPLNWGCPGGMPAGQPPKTAALRRVKSNLGAESFVEEVASRLAVNCVSYIRVLTSDTETH